MHTFFIIDYMLYTPYLLYILMSIDDTVIVFCRNVRRFKFSLPEKNSMTTYDLRKCIMLLFL